MKPFTLVVLFSALTAFASAADRPPVEANVIVVQGEHIKLVQNTMSPDGRYAGAWTVTPKKGKPAVDWKGYDEENNHFFDDYLDNEDYVITDVIVDLEHNAVAARLKFTEPYFNRKNHGDLEMLYGPEKNGHRYVIALSDGKWSPSDVVLVDLGPDGSSQADIHKLLDGTVYSYIGKHEKHMSGGYACEYMPLSLPELGLRTGFSDATTVRLPFSAAVPKSEDATYNGTILVHLSTSKGKPHADTGEVREGQEHPDPTTDDPRVVAADKELNATYAALRNKLDKEGKAKLVAEQREWIKERDDKVAALDTTNTDKSFVDNPRIAADHLLLQLTKERTEALRAR